MPNFLNKLLRKFENQVRNFLRCFDIEFFGATSGLELSNTYILE